MRRPMTSTNLHKKLTHQHTRNASDMEMWQGAIDEARNQLSRVEQRAMRLRAAIRMFQEKLETGAPWPR